MFVSKPQFLYSPARFLQPHALVDMVVAKPWTIVDLGRETDSPPAPYAMRALSTPREMAKYAAYKNIALLYESPDDATDVVQGLVDEEFPHNVALVDRSDWLAYWAAVDAGSNEPVA